MTELITALLALAATEYNGLMASFWLAWYCIRYGTIWENPLDSVPKWLVPFLPNLKFIVSLLAVVVSAVVTAGVALPAWAVMLSAVGASVLVWLSSNNLGQPKAGGGGGGEFATGGVVIRPSSISGDAVPLGSGGAFLIAVTNSETEVTPEKEAEIRAALEKSLKLATPPTSEPPVPPVPPVTPVNPGPDEPPPPAPIGV